MEEPRRLAAGEIKALVGGEIGVSEWIEVTQAKIDAFADVTGDWQFIHIDPERSARETPFGGAVAHGFLTLSLLSAMGTQVIPRPEGLAMGVNYGFDKLRFLSPVPAGSRVRGRFWLLEAQERSPGELTMKYKVDVEIEGSQKHALVAEWLTRQYFRPEI
ncbi:MAG: MaoC family dehydratase [Rhodomicrobium sp.]